MQYNKWIQDLSATLKRTRIRLSRFCTENQRTTKQCQPNWRLDEGKIMLQVWPERSHRNCMSRKEEQQLPRWWWQEQKFIVRILKNKEPQWKEEKRSQTIRSRRQWRRWRARQSQIRFVWVMHCEQGDQTSTAKHAAIRQLFNCGFFFNKNLVTKIWTSKN